MGKKTKMHGGVTETRAQKGKVSLPQHPFLSQESGIREMAQISS